MPIEPIHFALAFSAAQGQGLAGPDATRIGVIGAVLPNPIMAFVVGKTMATNKAEELQAAQPVPAGGGTTTPPEGGGQQPPVEDVRAEAKALILEAVGEALQPVHQKLDATAGDVQGLKVTVGRIADKVGVPPDQPAPEQPTPAAAEPARARKTV